VPSSLEDVAALQPEVRPPYSSLTGTVSAAFLSDELFSNLQNFRTTSVFQKNER